MSSSLATLYSSVEETHRELPMSATMYGVLALVAFGVLLGVLWFSRGTAQKMSGSHTHTRAPERG